MAPELSWAALSTPGPARVKSCRLPAARLAASCLQGEAGGAARDPEGRQQPGLHPYHSPPTSPPALPLGGAASGGCGWEAPASPALVARRALGAAQRGDGR